MPLPTSLQSYGDCLDFFERIVDDPKGGRIRLGTYEKASAFRMRCNAARQLHREENKKIHEPNTPLYGASEYDPFQLQLKDDTEGQWWVYAVRSALDPEAVELLSEVEDGNEA